MEELIRHFGIDWKLLLAQAVNFGILLAVLWKFAYRPILKILARRREEVENGLRAAAEARDALARIGALQREKLEDARREALAIVNRAQETARAEKDAIVAEAVRKGEALIGEAKRAIREEKAKLSEELEREARELVRDGVARVLGKMPAHERDKELIDQAIRAMKS